MELTEDEIIQKYGKFCGHRKSNTILPYKNKFNCFSCGYNANKKSMKSLKYNEKKIIFFKRLKYAELKIFCIRLDVYETYEGSD